MIINPEFILSSNFVRAFEDCPAIDVESQCQQVGIDVRVDKIYRISGFATMSDIEEEKIKPSYFPLVLDQFGFYHLQANEAYAIDTMEYIEVPADTAAFLIHRSTYNRAGALFFGSVYDSGFRGRISGTLYPKISLNIKWGSRIGQIVFVQAQSASLYSGQYQDQTGGYGEKSE